GCYLARLKRVEGQALGIHPMIDDKIYCFDILTQISALISALNNVALSVLDDHVRHCVVLLKPMDQQSKRDLPKPPTPSPGSSALKNHQDQSFNLLHPTAWALPGVDPSDRIRVGQQPAGQLPT